MVAGGYLFEAFLGTTYIGGVMLIAIIVLIYTASGGLFAVAYTDAIQVGIALLGTVLLFGLIATNYGITIPEGVGPLDLGQLADPAQGAAINWATLLALGLGDIVAIDFMARVFAADSPETAQRACLIGCLGTVIIGVPFSLIALSAGDILTNAGITADGPLLFGLLKGIVPPAIALLVIAAILSASLSTADGAILGTASVMAHNILGVRHDDHTASGSDRLLLLTRIMAVVITGFGVFFALKVPQTGILLLLAFDIGFAGLLIPLVGGLFWSQSTWKGALACIIVGTTTRLVFFVFMPTVFGIDNTLFYIKNSVFTADFDGFPTLISPLIGFLVFVIISKMTNSGERIMAENRQPELEIERI